MTLLRGTKVELLDEIGSTQDEVRRRLEAGKALPDILAATHQTGGRGRRGRSWHSVPGESLAMSFPLSHLAEHKSPWLLGMVMSIQTARLLDGYVRWPNDVVISGKKVSGVLTEMLHGIPVIGIGINLGQRSFPSELRGKATSLLLEERPVQGARDLADTLAQELYTACIPRAFKDIRADWSEVDDTPGKRFRLADGRTAEALSIGERGELICQCDGLVQSVMAAEAILE